MSIEELARAYLITFVVIPFVGGIIATIFGHYWWKRKENKTKERHLPFPYD